MDLRKIVAACHTTGLAAIVVSKSTNHKACPNSLHRLMLRTKLAQLHFWDFQWTRTDNCGENAGTHAGRGHWHYQSGTSKVENQRT